MSGRETRPQQVAIAYWLWLACAALLVLFGLLALTASGDAVRDQLLANGADPGDVDALVGLLRGSGALAGAVGVAIGFLAGPVRAGDPRFRRAAVALSAVYTLIQVLSTAVGVGQAPTLMTAIGLVIASILVYLPSARDWFVRG
ncbi:hypothetical protein ACFWPA_07065 [Rhodococcus sp. NPDC058505]|uniref:hypothetical protein n=1 Tax=unclassified Rhodococcus (in: high G+C Gram-positive bacteria) TaxID=192944 RepID=UPI0036478B8E